MFEKRRTQRIHLYSPLYAVIDDVRVPVIDISTAGARIEHSFPMHVGSAVEVTLKYESTSFDIRCVVVRSRLQKSVSRDAIVYTTGLDFADSSRIESLQELIHAIVGADFDARATYAIERQVT